VSLFPKDPRSVRPVHGLLFMGIAVILFEIGGSGMDHVRQWWGKHSRERGDCVYQILQEEVCVATLFLNGPHPVPAILKAGGMRRNTDCRDCNETVPCGRRIVVIGNPPTTRVEKIPGRQLVCAGQRINVNCADESDLTAVPGLGPVTAKRIVEYRESHGPFSSLEELRKIRGIGSKKLHSWQPYLEAAPSSVVCRPQSVQAAGGLLDPAIRSQENQVPRDPQVPD
jgi:competence ComEA-like helix-hairpin-helix protein